MNGFGRGNNFGQIVIGRVQTFKPMLDTPWRPAHIDLCILGSVSVKNSGLYTLGGGS
jgi:hypothetical protein